MESPDPKSSIKAEIERLAEKFSQSKDVAFCIWVAKLVLGLDETASFEASTVEGCNDKGIDVFYVDPDREVIFIAQCKYSDEFSASGKENHVNNLSASLTWLSNPSALKKEGRIELSNAADEYKEAINNGYSIELIYAHLGPRSVNVDKHIRVLNESNDQIDYNRHYRYYSLEALENVDSEFNNLSLRISSERLTLADSDTLRQKQDHYDALIANIPGSELSRIHDAYGDRLFDRNVRLYLGARKGSVNAGILRTLQDHEDSKNFWAYNNGITIICDAFEEHNNAIEIENFSIINGCQTTVTMSRSKGNLENVYVLAKIIKIRPENVDDVIRSNNSQNPIKAWDIASQHSVHRRLKEELSNLEKAYLYKTRRGDKPKDNLHKYKDGGKIRQIESDKLAQYRAAFLGNPVLAWKSKSEIFEPGHHDNFFSSDLRVEEALFTWIAGEVSSEVVLSEMKKTDSDQTKLILRNGGAYFVLAALSKVFKKRNGVTVLSKAQPASVHSNTTEKKLLQYAKYSLLNYVDAVTELATARELEIVPLLKSRDFVKQVLEKVERQFDRDSLAEAYINEALPKAELS